MQGPKNVSIMINRIQAIGPDDRPYGPARPHCPPTFRRVRAGGRAGLGICYVEVVSCCWRPFDSRRRKFRRPVEGKVALLDRTTKGAEGSCDALRPIVATLTLLSGGSTWLVVEGRHVGLGLSGSSAGSSSYACSIGILADFSMHCRPRTSRPTRRRVCEGCSTIRTPSLERSSAPAFPVSAPGSHSRRSAERRAGEAS